MSGWYEEFRKAGKKSYTAYIGMLVIGAIVVLVAALIIVF